MRIRLAIAMDRKKEDFLSEEFCCFDAKHNRCRGFVTLTASVYHLLLKKQVPLAIMEAEKENSETITLFWRLFNEVVKKESENGASFGIYTRAPGCMYKIPKYHCCCIHFCVCNIYSVAF